MINKERNIIRPSDLTARDSKAVVYCYNGYTIIVPDPACDMKGDLSKLPPNVQDVLVAPNKNHVRVSQAIIDDSSPTLAIPSGRKAI